MRLAFCKCVNAGPQVRQALINICCLLQDVAFGASLGNTLASRQIDQVQAALLLGTIHICLLVIYDEDGVTA